MPRFRLILKAIICIATLCAGAATFAQTLAGTWDLVESPDGRGPTAGTMTLSANGAVDFAGSHSTWQPNGDRVQFTVMGAMQVPATEITLQWNGSTLQGKLVAYKYRMAGGQAVRESERTFPLSARRPEGYAAPDTGNRQSTTPPIEQRSAQQGAPPEAAPSRAPAGKPAVPEQDQLEAVALCWQNTRNADKYGCDGPIQRTSMTDETLEKALDLVGCPNPRLTDGSRTIKNLANTVYLCGYGLVSSDRDVVQRNGLTVQRNTYSCPTSQWRCKGQRQ